MLQVIGLAAARGSRRLFEDIEFSLPAGAALLLRGPNGAGKTTLLRVLCGLTRPEAGQVFWQGKPCADGLRGPAAYGGHQAALSQDLTVAQNMAFYAELCGWPGDWPTIIEALGLEHCQDLEVRHLSAGQRRRAGLARVLVSGAPLWLLDEPSTHVDASGRQFIEQRIADHLESGGLSVIAVHGDIVLQKGEIATLNLGVN